MGPSPSHRTTDPASQSDIRCRLQKTWREIEDVKEQIRATIDQIEKANAFLTKLRTVEKELHEAAAATASLISPAKCQHVPIDIIGEIAGHLITLADDFFDESWIFLGFEPLTGVCRSCRTGTLSLPWVWSSFRVTKLKPNLQGLSTILERSANYPLSFEIPVLSENSSCPTTSLLVKHSRRWKNVKLFGYTGPTPLLALRGQLPQLEKLELSLNAHEADPWHNSNEEQDIFEDAPKLVELDIGDPPFTDGGSRGRVRFRFPLRQLRRVHWQHSTSPDEPVFRLDDLSNFVNVFHLYLGSSFPTTSLIGTVTIPRVASLVFDSESFLILTSLKLPSLKSLVFNEVYFEDDDVETITEFLTAHSESFSNWSLAAFALTVKDFMPARFPIDLLRHAALNNLHTLSWESAPPTDDAEGKMISNILALLIWTPPRKVAQLSASAKAAKPYGYWINIMPHLRNLTLRVSSPKFDYDTFYLTREVILSRTRSNALAEGTHRDAETAALDAPPGPIDEAPELTPAQLQYFCLRLDSSMPDITMKDLSTLIQGKFNILMASEDT